MRTTLYSFSFALLIVLLLGLDLAIGSVHIPWEEVKAVLLGNDKDSTLYYIVWELRLPAALSAIVVGAGLSLCGLQLQTLFRNPLADASLLGVTGGAGLGVALFMMAGSLFGSVAYFSGALGSAGMIVSAIIGAFIVLALVASMAHKGRDMTHVLIVGVMLSFITSSMVALLQYFAPAPLVKSFQVWSFGSLEAVSTKQLQVLLVVTLPAIFFATLYPKALNAILLGNLYARSVGISVKSLERTVILLSGIIAGTITAFVGPIAFVGIAVPYLVRLLSGSTNHRQLTPMTLLLGALFMQVCHIATSLPGHGVVLPINIVTSIVGAPFVITMILSRRHRL